MDFGQPQAPAEHGFDVALLARFFARRAHVFGNARIAREIAIHVLLRGGALDAELAGEPECRHAVDQAEVDHLGVAPLLGIDRRGLEAENFRRGRAMDVLARGERLEQACVLRDVRHDAQLDLRIVGGDDLAAGRAR